MRRAHSRETYSGEGGQGGEVLQGGQAADVEADHLELGKLLQVLFVLDGEALDRCLVEDQVIELATRERQGQTHGSASRNVALHPRASKHLHL